MTRRARRLQRPLRRSERDGACHAPSSAVGSSNAFQRVDVVSGGGVAETHADEKTHHEGEEEEPSDEAVGYHAAS